MFESVITIGFNILEGILNHGYAGLNKITQGHTNDY